MSPNEGTVDRSLRAAVGIALVGAAATGFIGAWGWIGIVPLATAIVGWCPLYWMLEIKTRGS